MRVASICGLVLPVILLGLCVAPADAAEIVVTSTADDGPGIVACGAGAVG